MAQGASTGAQALAESDVSLLIDLSEEVLVHIVTIGRFSLTDIGHLRATCTALRGFLDRIRDTVNECVVGDLSKYYPYGHWDIDTAAENGHFELIQLLHEDEVKHGRVSHCTNAALRGVITRGNFDAFVFLVRNRVHDVFPPTDGDCGSFYSAEEDSDDACAWENLTREQVLFLLDEAPGYLVGSAVTHAVQGPILRGEMDLVARLLPLVRSALLLVPLRFSFAHCRESMDAFKAVLAECKRRAVDDIQIAGEIFRVAAGSVGCGDELLNLALEHSPVALADLPKDEHVVYTYLATDPRVITRLREIGPKRTEANADASVDDIAYGIKSEWAPRTPEALVRLLLAGDYEAATCAARTMRGGAFHTVACLLADETAVDALQWMRAQNLLSIPYKGFISVPTKPSMALSAWVDFAWPLALELGKESSIQSVSWVAMNVWGAHAARVGDVALFRHLCTLIDVVEYSADGDTNAQWLANTAAMHGHWNVLSYMIDVNARIEPVTDSEASREPGAFELRERPFNLTRALEEAVGAGHVHLAHMLDRRVPGLKASLAEACASRRWGAFRFVLGRLDASERAQQCGDAFVEAVRRGRLDFMRWFEANEPTVVGACVSRLWVALLRRRDMSILHHVLTRHPQALAGKTCIIWKYDTFLLEHRLGVCLTPRPLPMNQLCASGLRDVLQAAIDFRVSVTTPRKLDSLQKKNSPLWRWLTERLAAGAFVVVPDGSG